MTPYAKHHATVKKIHQRYENWVARNRQDLRSKAVPRAVMSQGLYEMGLIEELHKQFDYFVHGEAK